MSNPFGPDCPHLQWGQGDQYATFAASTQTEYDTQVAARQLSAGNQDLEFDGDPHLCEGLGEHFYVVKLKSV